MLRLIIRKLLLMLILLPILNGVGYHYALIHPRFFGPRSRPQGAEAASGYLDYIGGFPAGDFGHVRQVEMLDLVGGAFVNSLVLIGFALAVTAVFGVLIGFLSISSRTNRIRPAGLILTTAGASIPGFLLGGVVISVIVYQTLYGGMTKTPLPMSGFGVDEHLILPLIVLAVRPTLHLAKVTAGLLENELHKNYIRTARSKGAHWTRVYWRHAFGNIISPIIVVLGQSLRFIVGGLLIAEMMFLWPGIGRFFVFSLVANENFQGQFQYFAHPQLIATLAVLMGFLLLTADLTSGVIAYAVDPRIRAQE